MPYKLFIVANNENQFRTIFSVVPGRFLLSAFTIYANDNIEMVNSI